VQAENSKTDVRSGLFHSGLVSFAAEQRLLNVLLLENIFSLKYVVRINEFNNQLNFLIGILF